MPDPDSKSIRVSILAREYPLRVAPADEAYTIHLAAGVDERLTRLRNNIPTQPDLTHAVIGALEMAGELYATRSEVDQIKEQAVEAAEALTAKLDKALAG